MYKTNFMQKTIIYSFFLLFIALGGITNTSCNSQKDSVPALLERKTKLGSDEEQALIKTTYDNALAALKKKPDDLQQYINIASVFVAEGRITGNNSYYSNAAMKMLNKITGSKTGNKDIVFQALNIQSTIELNMHQFKDALITATKGAELNNYNSGIYGALVDANVEMGNYEEAVKDCDKMIGLRPDLRSYSRASYLRQIFGQNTAAILAMKMAVQAGMPGSENTEWARTTLGDLYLNTGNADSASITYRTSLVYRPGYAYALIGMAKVAKAKKNYEEALTYTKQAIKTLSDASFVSQLADIYELLGDKANAKETREEVVSLLEAGQRSENSDVLIKHNVNRELAAAWMNDGNYDKALKYAKNDLEMRPSNIDANELAAWICYLKGDYVQAKVYAEKMLVTHTKNAVTLYKAGAIYAKNGELSRGEEYINTALSICPFIDQRIIDANKSSLALNTK